MFREDQLLPISALQHLLFCERQAALIHVEQLWAENRLTVEGALLHQRAHAPQQHAPTRQGVRVTRSLQLSSLRLGLAGVADVVEYPPDAPPFPVEYKRGKVKKHRADEVQLCAQALCLEEMLETSVPSGALFYGQVRRRLDVSFDDELRGLTEQAAARFHEIIATGQTPIARREKKCDRCSLLNLCLPDAIKPRKTASAYLKRASDQALAD
jgi:CRISPR-associated exonuclease Cas4